MKISKITFLIITITLFCQCKVFQYEDTPRDTNKYLNRNMDGVIDRERGGIRVSDFEKGKCYAKCLISDKTEFQSEEYIEYTGNELEENVDIEYREIVIQKESSKWVKKKADRNCLSSNPNDCLVWCLVEVPEITKEIKILIDTTQSKNYEIKRIDYKVVTEKGGFTEWRSVLCEKDITKLIIGQIQNSLKSNGYYEGRNTQVLDVETKASLTKFQKDNNLPVGQLDFESLDALGIIVN